jgi:hypothetical protein
MKLFRKLFAPSPSNESLNSPPQTVPSGKDGVMSKSSPTPLTDREVLKLLQCGPVEKVSAEFARNLERKLYANNHRNNGINPMADGKASG